MPDPTTLIRQAYAAFNRRDIPAALALMTPDIRWPKASEGGTILGHDEIRAYWTRQWAQFSPHVEPLTLTPQPGGTIRVTVHQLVRSLQGQLLSDSRVTHIFTLRDGLIAAMHLGDEATAAAAFHPH